MKLILGGYGVMGRVVEGLKGPTKGRCHYRLLPP